MQRQLKFRLRFHEKVGGFEKWYEGAIRDGLPLAKPQWLYSRDGGVTWEPEYISHRSKDEWTGLKDKNGKEIYEGDIINLRSYPGRFSVFFHKGSFKVTHGGEGYPMEKILEPNEVEVIGNIYENPELLEPEKEV